MDDLGQVFLVQLPVLVLVKFFKLFLKEPFISVYRTVQETCYKLCVVHLTAVVEVHSLKDLSDVVFLEFDVDLFPQIVKANHHLVVRNHAVAVLIKFEEDFSQVLDLFFWDLYGQIH